jgi:cellulose synthase/poly-beta-1,6-N-acetylglucosamine synthase-like glycosyltransferase
LLHLEAALALEVDPLDYCANRFGLGHELVMERAALWAGLTYAQRVPNTLPGSPIIERIERLGDVRTVRAKLFNEEVIYSAPHFSEFLALRRHAWRHPEFRRRFCVVPEAAIRSELAAASEDVLLTEARHRLFRRWPRASAHVDLPVASRFGFAAGLLGVLLLAVLAPFFAKAVFVPLVGLILVVPAALRLWAAFARPAPQPEPPLLDDSDLPVYTVLLPLRDEAHMVRQLCNAMRDIDYPPEKLEVLFLVEQRSPETVIAVAGELHDPRFELLLVPDALPRTKPKALNYALPFVRGEHVVVYDAEDIPEPGQLRRAASTFAQRPELHCLQAELVVDNAGETWLTALFAGEYAGQFGLMLPLLARLGLPMPLGGTSNHFRSSVLREIGGWDPFNVTEDADLGVRLARRGLRTDTIASRTAEEAPVRLRSWLTQRTRWMKGWMQTFIVHNSHPRELLADLGLKGFLGFQVYVGSMILSGPLHTLFVLSLAMAMLLGGISFDGWFLFGCLVFLVGYGGPAALAVAGLSRLGRAQLIPVQALLPVYWVLHSVAGLRALHELIVRPYFWAKTQHGETRLSRHRLERRAPAQAE